MTDHPLAESAREEGVTAAFSELAEALVGDYDVIHYLHTLTDLCVQVLEVSAAGVLLSDGNGHSVEAAASDERTYALELASVEWDEGPCRDCTRDGTAIAETYLDTAEARARWPHFAERALAVGFTSVVAAPLRLGDRTLGALNLFREENVPLPPGRLRLSQALADNATLGIIQQRTVHEQLTVNAQLQRTLDSRALIEQAKGFLAHRHDISPDAAFVLLRRYAHRHRTRLTDLARSVLDGTASAELRLPGPRPAR
ncbi:transcriptional regulator [Streptomyces sp. Ru73]|uniref:GAF and ANTAR domain-containing protein n=1 Tax=Streptomyces sp. Ru73 TaxID=2080748 RepID=UPI000CDE0B6E|nr:GAF and ANTAR domain-containing protein [Streptomyces sp. Ru73]POX42834.1 transcriptional regulator [Streptomyces sp. Ru73]